MTPTLRTARLLTVAALLSAGTAAYLLATGSYWLAVGAVYVAAFLAWCARREYVHHRIARYRAALAERAARGLPIDPAVFKVIPCCGLSTHADGRTHGPDCLHRYYTDDEG